MISIGVKSKYGSCSGNCTGLIKINNNQKKKACYLNGISLGYGLRVIGSSPIHVLALAPKQF
jgi:hypothetical protein